MYMIQNNKGEYLYLGSLVNCYPTPFGATVFNSWQEATNRLIQYGKRGYKIVSISYQVKVEVTDYR